MQNHAVLPQEILSAFVNSKYPAYYYKSKVPYFQKDWMRHKKNFIKHVKEVDENGCYIWDGDFWENSRTGRRTPRFRYQLNNKRLHMPARQFFLAALLGQWPEIKRANTTCLNEECVNPRHMVITSAAYTGKLKKLSLQDQMEIRILHNGKRQGRGENKSNSEELAKLYGVARSSINKVLRGVY